MWQAAGMRRLPYLFQTHRSTWLLYWLCTALCLWITPAHAWGYLGHRITGEIAAAHLAPNTQRRVAQLLGEESLATAATYMDQHRQDLQTQWPQSARWHYDNQPVCGNAGYCRDGQCATTQLPHFQQVLSDPRRSRSERAQALHIVIHLIGDIHQPLHMADDNDRGGNDLWVRLYAGAKRRNLHELYDTELVKQLMGKLSVPRYAHALQRQFQTQLNTWSLGTPNQWAQQTHELAAQHVYNGLPGFACGRTLPTLTLTSAYLDTAKQDVAEQLTKAGLRLAAFLNATLP